MLGANYAEALVGAGRIDQAANVILQNLLHAREAHSRHVEGVALRVQGQVRSECKQWDEAATLYGQAIAIFEQLGSRLELSRALEHRGGMWDALGNAAAAEADMSRARTLLEGCRAEKK